MKYLLYISLACVTGVAGCVHVPEALPELTGEDRAAACRIGKRDKELFCHETGVSRTFSDATCWKAKKKMLEYCD